MSQGYTNAGGYPPTPLLGRNEQPSTPTSLPAAAATAALAVPQSAVSGITAAGGVRPGQPVPETSTETAIRTAGTGDDRHHDHPVGLRQQRPDRLRPGVHPGAGILGPAGHARRAHWWEIVVEIPSTRRPAQAARGPGPVAVRRHAGDLQAGPGGPVHEGTARAAGRPAARPRQQPTHPDRHLRGDPPPGRGADRGQDADRRISVWAGVRSDTPPEGITGDGEVRPGIRAGDFDRCERHSAGGTLRG